MPSAKSKPGLLDRFFGQDQTKARNEVRELLQVAMNYFMEGRRPPAIPYLEQVLNHRFRDPNLRLAAAGLMAEVFRGTGDFLRAQQYYQLSLDESDMVENKQGSQWYDHYRPRSQLGLITVLRRSLANEHDRITRELREARESAAGHVAKDLAAQLDAAEGLYLRQVGDVEGSVRRLRMGLEGMKGMNPPFAFLSPEHFEALLALSYLCTEGSAILADQQARAILKARRGPWSTAVAAASLLHIHYRMKADDLAEGLDLPSDEETRTETEGWFQSLREKAAWELDPLLISEDHVLRIVEAASRRDRTNLVGLHADLARSILETAQAVKLLRAVEVGSLIGDLIEVGEKPPREVDEILRQGLSTLDTMADRLASYRMDLSMIQGCRAILTGETRGSTPLALWNSDAVKSLRCRTWP